MSKRLKDYYYTDLSTKNSQVLKPEDAPETLKNHIFYGMTLDEDQQHYRDAIWSKDKLVVICDSVAGSGKTCIAVMTANLLVKYRRYDGIVYIVAPTQESSVGFLPGDISEKISPYFEPFYDAALKADINIDTALTSDIVNEKNGTAYIDLRSHNYLRGVNFENKVVIVDEAQNLYTNQLQKVITRCHDNCKVILAGHSGQVDLSNSEGSGLAKYIKHAQNIPFVEVCTLTHNYRGVVSKWADDIFESDKGENV